MLSREIWPVASSCWMRAAKSCEESMGAKRASAMWAATRKTAEVRAMVVVAARWRRWRAEHPGDGGSEGEGGEGERGGQAQRGEAGAGEVEEAGHGERVVADAAMGEQVADVGDERRGGARSRGRRRARRRSARPRTVKAAWAKVSAAVRGSWFERASEVSRRGRGRRR